MQEGLSSAHLLPLGVVRTERVEFAATDDDCHAKGPRDGVVISLDVDDCGCDGVLGFVCFDFFRDGFGGLFVPLPLNQSPLYPANWLGLDWTLNCPRTRLPISEDALALREERRSSVMLLRVGMCGWG